MGKTVRIPIEQIDKGIIFCLQNSHRINKTAKALLLDWKLTGQEVKQHDSKYSIVLFYYAVEELGKAIRLEEYKKEAEVNNRKYVEDDKLFSDHNYKINIAQSKYPDLKIPNWKQEPIRENTYKLIPYDEIIHNFVERSNFWLVDYNPESGKWISKLPEVDDDEILKRLEQLDKIIDEWQNQF